MTTKARTQQQTTFDAFAAAINHVRDNHQTLEGMRRDEIAKLLTGSVGSFVSQDATTKAYQANGLEPPCNKRAITPRTKSGQQNRRVRVLASAIKRLYQEFDLEGDPHFAALLSLRENASLPKGFAMGDIDRNSSE